MNKKKEETGQSVFDTLNSIVVNEHVEKKNGLTYLSWVWAWSEFKKRYPDATYEVKKFENGLPYAYDENTGYMVYTSVTVGDLTQEMWLPVMDSTNHAMKRAPYSVKTKYKSFTVNAATMFDVNKAIMRCLTKNLAMFGLGLYIYAGEDLPEEVDQANTSGEKKGEEAASKSEKEEEDKDKRNEIKNEILALAKEKGYTAKEIAARYSIDGTSTVECLQKVLDEMQSLEEMKAE